MLVFSQQSAVVTTTLVLMLCVLLPFASAASKKRVSQVPVAVDFRVTPVVVEDCEIVKTKCAYRDGCGAALHNYMMGCGDVMAGKATRCSEPCKKALIAIASTDEGNQLMTCDCKDNEFCYVAKERLEICRQDVMEATAVGSVVSCSIAQLICSADPLCSAALGYYHKFCKHMFQGRKCTMRCNNSIDILNRQLKAEKLKTCRCDGTEDYNCKLIKSNMEKLCFYKSPERTDDIDNHLVPNELPQSPTRSQKPDGTNSSNHHYTSSMFHILLAFAYLKILCNYIRPL